MVQENRFANVIEATRAGFDQAQRRGDKVVTILDPMATASMD